MQISEICTGYYVKLNTNSKLMEEKKKWAVLYAFRPWSSHFGEPQVAVMEMKDGKMIKDAPVTNINASEIVAIGGLANSICADVIAWLTANMPCYKSIRTAEQLAEGTKPRAAPRVAHDAGRAIEESLAVLDAETLRERYVSNMRAYSDELMANKRCLLGFREGTVKWTKVEEGKENVLMSTTIKKATTDFDKWWIRQLLRTVETICVITEFQPKASHFTNAMIFFQTLMSDHEEEILVHLNANVDYSNPDVAKAYTLLPLCHAIHKLKDDNTIQDDVYVPAMMADVILSLIALTTADLNTAQLKHNTAWLPKQVRLLYNKIQYHFETNNKEPEWVAAVRTKNEDVAVLGGSKAMADASSRMSGKGAAPGEPGGLKDAKPLKQVKAKKFDPKNRGLDTLPLHHVDDFETFDDGKTNKTRMVGSWARFATGSGGRTKTQLHRWCICDVSKDKANKESATYPGHFASTQGSSSNRSAHPNQGKDGCSFAKFTPDLDKAGPGSAKGKGKHAAAAATSNSNSTVADADLKRAVSHIEHLNDQIKQLGAS